MLHFYAQKIKKISLQPQWLKEFCAWNYLVGVKQAANSLNPAIILLEVTKLSLWSSHYIIYSTFCKFCISL